MTAEPIRFAIVGITALLLHFLTVVLLVPAGLPPLAANCLGFAVAFQASFFGHSRWTFPHGGTNGRYPKLLLLSSSGFAINEISYAALLRFSAIDYRIGLACVLAAISAGTYLASKFWVFRKRSSADRATPASEEVN